MKHLAAAAILVLTAIGLAALVYIESASDMTERAARKRGCLLCHGKEWSRRPLPCLAQWQHGTPLSPHIRQHLLAAHPKLPGADTDAITRYLLTRQLPLLAEMHRTSQGEALYNAKCAACHGANGEGQADTYPPLAGSEWLTNSPERPSAEDIIKNGIQGPISVKGQPWNAVMLPPGISSPQDIQALLQYLEQFR